MSLLCCHFSNKLSNPSCLGLSRKDQMAYILKPKLEQREVILPSGSCSFFTFIFSTSQLSPQSIIELGVHCYTSHSCSNIQANERARHAGCIGSPPGLHGSSERVSYHPQRLGSISDRMNSLACILAFKPHPRLRTTGSLHALSCHKMLTTGETDCLLKDGGRVMA